MFFRFDFFDIANVGLIDNKHSDKMRHQMKQTKSLANTQNPLKIKLFKQEIPYEFRAPR